MSKVTIALGSFIIGACFAFTIVPGNASTFCAASIERGTSCAIARACGH
jgi:hypothetical protein